MHELISTWSNFSLEQSPYVLPDDGVLLEEKRRLIRRFPGWNAYIADPEFGSPTRSQLHIDLLPMPYVGNLKSASTFFLMLNPGVGPHDYFGEYEVPEYREALIDNLRQDKHNSFLFLDPRFSWHGGFNYWHRKLHSTIDAFASSVDISYGQARQYFQSQIAALQLVPYHSSTFSVPGGVLGSLSSAQLVISYVRDVLIPRSSNGRLVIATRATKHWPVSEDQKNVVCYTASESRSAHLGPESRGGAAMLRFLIGKYRAEHAV